MALVVVFDTGCSFQLIAHTAHVPLIFSPRVFDASQAAAFATVQLRIPNCITQRLLLTVPKPRQSFALRCVCVCELRDGRPDARRGRGKEGKGPRERKRFRREYHRRRRQTVVCEKELSIHSHTFLFEKGRQPTGCVRLHTPLL